MRWVLYTPSHHFTLIPHAYLSKCNSLDPSLESIISTGTSDQERWEGIKGARQTRVMFRIVRKIQWKNQGDEQWQPVMK